MGRIQPADHSATDDRNRRYLAVHARVDEGREFNLERPFSWFVPEPCEGRPGRFPEWSLWALDKRRAGLLTGTFWSDGHPDATSVSDRLLLGLPRAPLQQRLKLGIAQLVDRFPSRDAPRADPVVREGFAQPLSGEFVLLLRGSTAAMAGVPCLGRPLEYLVHPMPLPGLGALPVPPGGDKSAILGQPLSEPNLPFGP